MDQALLYKKNLLAIKEVNQKLYKRLEAIQTNEKYEVFLNQKDLIDINIYDNHKKIALYKNPIQDTVIKIEEFAKFIRYPFMVFFGFGNGVFIKSLLNNENLTNLIIIEPEIEILYISLHFLDYTEELLSKRLTILYTGDIDYYTIRQFIVSGAFGAYLKTYNMHIMSPYYGSYRDELLRVNGIFIDAILHFVHSHGNDSKDSIIGLEHFIMNLPRMLKNNTFKSLTNAKNSSVAVMVSTGPSLVKQLELLKQIQDNVTIICIDASMPILEKHGITPDIVCSIERVVETAKFFETTSKDFHDKIVFVSSALQHEAIYKNIKGGDLCIAMRPFEYMMHFGFNEFGYTGIGMSAANMGLEIAYLMHYEKLIMIGQDLAYGDDGKSHASGHVYGENEKSYDETDSFILGWGGHKMVRTSNVWRMFLNFFITDIQDAKEKMTVINCTEGGARIDGTIEMRFADAIESTVDKSFVKQKIKPSKLPTEITKLNLRKAKEVIEDILIFAKKSKKQIEEVFLDIAKECETLKELNEKKDLEKIDFDHIKELLRKIDDIKALCSKEKFRVLFWDAIQSFFLSLEMENALIAVKPADTEDDMKVKLIEFLFAHKPFLYLLAGGVDTVITVIERAKTNLYEEVNQI